MTDPTIRDNAAAHRFEKIVDHHAAVATYSLAGDVIIFEHTVVPEALRGLHQFSRDARCSMPTCASIPRRTTCSRTRTSSTKALARRSGLLDRGGSCDCARLRAG